MTSPPPPWGASPTPLAAPPPGRRPRPWRERAGWLPALNTVWIVVSAFFATTACIVYSAMSFDGNGVGTVWTVVGWMYGIGIATLLAFRHRYPVLLCIAACAGALLFPLDAIGALIALSIVVSTRPMRDIWWLGGLTVAATSVALLRDYARPADAKIFATTATESGPAVPFPLWFYVLMILGGLGLSVGVGWAQRTHRTIDKIQGEVRQKEVITERLRDEVARQDERELIAREVHDTLAHRLSLVSLHSGALEVAAPEDDPILRDAAQVVRLNAHQSLEDLRDLIDLLRDPEGLANRARGGSLAQLPELLAATREAGTQLVATVMLNDAASASPQLARATYRILQESLTNIHKHAPGSAVEIDLHGDTVNGVRVRVTNRVPPHHTSPPGSGAGLTGIAERARLLGGWARIGPVGNSFVVDVWLPWSASAPGTTTPPGPTSSPPLPPGPPSPR